MSVSLTSSWHFSFSLGFVFISLQPARPTLLSFLALMLFHLPWSMLAISHVFQVFMLDIHTSRYNTFISCIPAFLIMTSLVYGPCKLPHSSCKVFSVFFPSLAYSIHLMISFSTPFPCSCSWPLQTFTFLFQDFQLYKLPRNPFTSCILAFPLFSRLVRGLSEPSYSSLKIFQLLYTLSLT